MIRRSFLALPFLAAAASRPIAVIAHRAAHARHRENTIPAITAAMEMGVDYVELDVRTTEDGALVLHHNAALESKGVVRDLTLAEIRGHDARVPLFDEALAALRGKCGLYLDWKAASAAALVEALHRHDMVARTVVYGSFAGLSELRRMEPKLRVMPEAVSVEALKRSLSELQPRVVAFDRNDFKDDIIQVARDAKVDIFVDRLGADDNPAAWRDAIARGATGIQTDKPAELLAFR